MIRMICLLVICAAVVSAQKQRPIGGDIAAPGSHPYMVSIQLVRVHICGGTLVTQRHVVTSASCIAFAYMEHEKLQVFTVLVGTVDQTKGGSRHHVSRISAHPNYAWYDPHYNTTDYDIGVIRLIDQVVLSRDVQPIPLGFDFVEDVPMVLLGWGKSEEFGPETELVLKFGTVIYLKKKQCQKYFPDFKVKDRHLCNLPTTGIGACTTDLGGPLISEGKLVGVLTNVRNCGEGKPDIYISVFFHAHFLVDMLREEDD